MKSAMVIYIRANSNSNGVVIVVNKKNAICVTNIGTNVTNNQLMSVTKSANLKKKTIVKFFCSTTGKARKRKLECICHCKRCNSVHLRRF